MNRGVVTAGGLAILVLAGAVGFRVHRGSVGEVVSTAPTPEFSALDGSRWANGAPISLAASKGEVVFVEGWSPG